MVGGMLAERAGFAASFAMLGAVATLAMLLFVVAMPETRYAALRHANSVAAPKIVSWTDEGE